MTNNKTKLTLSDIMFYSMDDHKATYAIVRLQLDQIINKELMQSSFEKTCKRFPYFQTKLQEANVGFELVKNDSTPTMHEDPLDYIIDASENDGFLYRFSVLENVITFSIFHGLTDGGTIINFLKVLLTDYYEQTDEAVTRPEDLYDIDGQIYEEETINPLEKIPEDIPSLPYTGSTFYHLPEGSTQAPIAYTFSINESELMKYASQYEASPNAVATIAMAKSIYSIHPESLDEGIDIGISINAKPIIGLSKSYWPFLQTSIFHFDHKNFNLDEETLHTCIRGKVFADCTEEKLFPALAGVRSLDNIFTNITDENARKQICLKSTEVPRSTATISYTGISDFGSVGKHILGLYSFCDSAVPTLEINCLNDKFYFAISGPIDTKDYAQGVISYFNEQNISCSPLEPVNFNK